jgi:Uma2 family endonuclease
MSVLLTKPQPYSVILEGVAWDTYECLLRDYEGRDGVRLTYDKGVLELVNPSAEHEEDKQAIDTLIELIALEWDLDFRNLGSTTFKREDLQRGFEPDICFYFPGTNQEAEEDDAPPDLAVEVDHTNPSLDKMALYAQAGVPEVWRHIPGGALTIFLLRQGVYEISDTSRVLYPLTRTVAEDFLRQSHTLRRPEWARRIREWAQNNGREE